MKLLALALLGAACASPANHAATPTPSPSPLAGSAAAPMPVLPASRPFSQLTRARFNQAAAEHFAPLFWRTDANGDGALQPAELVGLWGPGGERAGDPLAGYVKDGQFTAAFATFYATLRSPPATPAAASPAERARRQLMLDELAQGRPTLVETDLRAATAEDRAIVDHVLAAAVTIERIYARQNGVLGLDAQIAADDPASKMVFFRNQGPACAGPRTEKDPACTAVAGQAKPPSGLYPASIQQPGFCDTLAKLPGGKAMTGHFTIVVDGVKSAPPIEARAYNVAYKDDMEAVAVELEAAAKAIASPAERPFAAYLTAAAKAFRTNDWESADEAWAEMGAKGSAWYLRIAPDEVYHDPCALKAGFHVSFARQNPASAAWRQKLEPVKDDLEAALAKLAGAPYVARKVKFKLPDFIDMILNAGDARTPTGATIGESLPNWGKVAVRGGRTVVMTNLYTDADSADALRAQAGSLLCPTTAAKLTTDPAPGLMSVVLHEAAHNLGPTHDYKVGGKLDDAQFGGTLSAMMEELKAETAALYFTDWLVEHKLITAAEAEAAHVRSLTWQFGHIAQGMYTGAGTPKTYSQLAAIQLGTLVGAGVLTWKADAKAANGEDLGCLELDLATWKPAVEQLARRVFGDKARGDKADAEKMKATFVDAKDDAYATLRQTIATRWLRAPKASFVYSISR
jgi:hypothetical protein